MSKIILLLLLVITVNDLFLKAEELEVKLASGKKTTIYYEVEGEGKPFFILHSGIKGYFDAVMKDQKNIKKIYIDPPGIGKSTVDESINNADKCLEVILSAIDILSDQQKFLIAGFSYFGYMARGVVSKRSNLIDGLVLICPVIYPEKAQRNLPVFKISEIDTAFINSLSNDEKNKLSTLTIQNKISYDVLKKYSNDEVGMNVKFWNKIKENNYSLSFNPDETNTIREFPALVFVGLRDNIVGYKDALKLFDVYRDLSFVSVSNASHQLPYEQNKVFSENLSNWINNVRITGN